MNQTVVISVSRTVRPREVLLRRLMAVLAAVFLAQGILFSTGFMLPCFLMTLCYFWFSHASRREYEYTLEDGLLRIERVSDRGRRVLHEIPFSEIQLLCRPDAPEALPTKKAAASPSGRWTIPPTGRTFPYTMIAAEKGHPLTGGWILTEDGAAGFAGKAGGGGLV